MYTQLPDYGDFQGYDLGRDGALNHVGRKLYANFHKPPWRTLKRHSLSAEIAKELFIEIDAIAEKTKKGDRKQERMFGRVAKIPLANAFSELAVMHFADYGDLATFLRSRDTFSRFSAIVI